MQVNLYEASMYKVLAVCFLILFIAGEASATTYYVARKGSNNNSGTESKPFKTIKYGARQLRPGDTLNIKEKNYAAVILSGIKGTAANPIIIQNFENDKVIIDRNRGYKRPYSFRLDKCSHLVIDGFKVTDSDPDIDKSVKMDPYNARDRKFLNAIDGNGGFKISACSNITIKNCEIYHTNGTAINAATGGKFKNSNLHILNNVIHSGITAHEAYGMYILGANHTIAYNTVYNCTGHGIRLGSHVLPFNNGLVENNIVYDNGGKAWLHPYSQTVKVGGSGIIIDNGGANTVQNNLVYQSASYRKKYFQDKNSDGISIDGPKNIVVNNTVYNMAEDGLQIHGKQTRRTIIRNNILYKNRRKAISYTRNATPKWQTLSHNQFSNPSFINPAKSDFRLPNTSDAVDVGTTNNAPRYDIEGKSRFKGARFDIGAYEYPSKTSFGVN